ncbi:hypothetical protein SHIRM173S_00434 [Streptomyces hirsutus]
MLREQKYAAERHAHLSGALARATGRTEADALGAEASPAGPRRPRPGHRAVCGTP